LSGDEKVEPRFDSLKYQRNTIVASDELMTLKLRYKEPDGDKSKLLEQVFTKEELKKTGESGAFVFAGCVAEFGMLLRDSKYKGKADYKKLLARAKKSQGADLDGYRAEFIKLVKKAKALD
jgi:Ca-activated chloride channel homolog